VKFLRCRTIKLDSLSVMEDATGKNNKSRSDLIQETGQEPVPARMVGLSSLDFKANLGMEAEHGVRVIVRRQGREAR
jgi:hypothetical protein